MIFLIKSEFTVDTSFSDQIEDFLNLHASRQLLLRSAGKP